MATAKSKALKMAGKMEDRRIGKLSMTEHAIRNSIRNTGGKFTDPNNIKMSKHK
jgi:hypothetical protein